MLGSIAVESEYQEGVVIMGATQRMNSMGFTDERFPGDTHMCLIYDDDSERRKVIGRFLDAGLREREKAAYFTDVTAPEEVRAWLAELGTGLPLRDDSAGQLVITNAVETYCPKGVFVPDEMLQGLRAFHDTACREGYSGSRVSGEMSWALRGIPGSERLMEYEARVNEVLATHPVIAICQYDARRFSGAMIFDVLKVHPMMVVNGTIVRNPYYVLPQELLGRAPRRE